MGGLALGPTALPTSGAPLPQLASPRPAATTWPTSSGDVWARLLKKSERREELVPARFLTTGRPYSGGQTRSGLVAVLDTIHELLLGQFQMADIQGPLRPPPGFPFGLSAPFRLLP